MEIINFFESDKQEIWLEQLKNCSWSAVRYLYKAITENKVEEMLSKDCKLYLLVEGNQIISFATLSSEDCIIAPSLKPWIGFVYTFEKYRGQRMSQKLINHLCIPSIRLGYKKIYLASKEVGLFEKYNFQYLKNQVDKYGYDERIYVRYLANVNNKIIPQADIDMLVKDKYEG